jgi:hypothetical protein
MSKEELTKYLVEECGEVCPTENAMVAAYNRAIEDAVKISKDCYWLVDSTEARSGCLRVEEKLSQLKIKD